MAIVTFIQSDLAQPGFAQGEEVTVTFDGWSRPSGWGYDLYGTGDATTGYSTTYVGSVEVSGTADVSPTGVSSSFSIGSPSVTGDANIYPTGAFGTGEVGDASAQPVLADVTGVEATTSVGTVSATGGADALVDVTGVQATGFVAPPAAVGVIVDCNVFVAGLRATGYSGKVLVWGKIIPSQTPSWTVVSPSQSPNWTKVAA